MATLNICTSRFVQGNESTVGRLIINQFNTKNFILEDEDKGLTSDMSLEEINRIKVYGRTAIPTGIYPVYLTKSTKFGGRMWPQLMGVPGYDGIRPHKGNFIVDTLGCQLPGSSWDRDKNGYLRVWNSGVVFDPLKAQIEEAIRFNNKVFWEIKREYIIHR